jgi:hypothetical protein
LQNSSTGALAPRTVDDIFSGSGFAAPRIGHPASSDAIFLQCSFLEDFESSTARRASQPPPLSSASGRRGGALLSPTFGLHELGGVDDSCPASSWAGVSVCFASVATGPVTCPKTHSSPPAGISVDLCIACCPSKDTCIPPSFKGSPVFINCASLPSCSAPSTPSGLDAARLRPADSTASPWLREGALWAGLLSRLSRKGKCCLSGSKSVKASSSALFKPSDHTDCEIPGVLFQGSCLYIEPPYRAGNAASATLHERRSSQGERGRNTRSQVISPSNLRNTGQTTGG